MAKISKDFSSGNLHPRENILGTGNIAALNAEVVINCDGASTVSLDLRGTFNLTVEVSGTIDGTNWTAIPIKPINQASKVYLLSLAGSTQGSWFGPCNGYRQVRVRCTAFTSGSAATTLIASNTVMDVPFDAALTSNLGTNTGAAGAAVTLTLAAPGTGLRHYVTYLRILRFATAALTAAATPVIVTTTNLPGSLAFSIPAEAALQGTIFAYQEDFSFPIATSAQNTATTIVCPATTSVIWRATAGFYVAP